MPIYSYKCENCDHHFDQFQHFTDDPLTVCPDCQAVALRKVYQPVGIVFKGKGFYATDHRSPSGQQHSHHSDTESDNGSKPQPEKKSESAPKVPAKANATPSAE